MYTSDDLSRLACDAHVAWQPKAQNGPLKRDKLPHFMQTPSNPGEPTQHGIKIDKSESRQPPERGRQPRHRRHAPSPLPLCNRRLPARMPAKCYRITHEQFFVHKIKIYYYHHHIVARCSSIYCIIALCCSRCHIPLLFFHCFPTVSPLLHEQRFPRPKKNSQSGRNKT